MFEVVYYKTRNGKVPAQEFIESLDEKGRKKVDQKLKLLEKKGNGLREPHSKPLGDNLFELRVSDRSNAYRFIYFFKDGMLIVVTSGFAKKTQKTPQSEIELANKYRMDFLARF